MVDFTKHFATRLRRVSTPQREPIPASTQLANSAGGFTWAVDRWARLDRFLVLGTEGGTYYIDERPLTQANAGCVVECLREDGARVVQRTIDVSRSGRAPKNDPALFVLAMAAGIGDEATRAQALAALPLVARTSTHLFHWLRFVQGFRGWGRGVRTAVSRWYTTKSATELGYQILKYQSRDGWSHRDALRLAHPKAPSVAHDLLLRYAVKGWEGALELRGVADTDVVERIEAIQALRQMTPAEASRVIGIYQLTREMVPTHLLSHAVVWEALLHRMPLTALVRNLGVMSKVGLLTPGSDATQRVVARLVDRAALKRARVHPLALLAALKTYAQGCGARGAGRWSPVSQVVDGLDGAFYLSFDNAPSTGKRVMLALDVSGSMVAPVHGLPFVSCREAAAAMALVTAATEPQHRFVAFTCGTYRTAQGWNTGLTPLAVSPRQRLDDVVQATGAIPFGNTDCALPMVEALKNGWAVDVFVIYTDNETWAGEIHPAQALREYRERTGIAAKLVVVGMASNEFSIADPEDAGMLDVVGFDAATPAVISDLVTGSHG